MKKTIFIILIIFLVPAVVFAEIPTRKLLLGYIEFPPYTYTSPSGKPEGILIDLAAKVFPKAGYEWTALSYPVKRMAEYLGSGDIDIWMGLKTLPSFIEKTYIGNEIVADLLLNAYTIGKKSSITKKEDLVGKSVIILRGYSYGGWVNFIADKKNNVHYIKANKHLSALKMLKANRADYLLDYKEPVELAMDNIEIYDLQHNKISSLPCYFIVTKQLPDGAEIIKKLETVFLEMKKNGQL